MSPRVQLVIYPDGDSGFLSHASVSMTISLPGTYSAREVVEAVEEHLRARYPLAAILVSPPTNGEFEATWHVYRDGLPSHAVEEQAGRS
jgi:hypothetical protein